MFVQICFGLSILFLFVLLVVFIYLNSFLNLMISHILIQEFILTKCVMFQFVRAGKCVFKMAVTTSKGEVDGSRACKQDCSAV